MNEHEVTGRARGHIVELETRCALHRDAVGPFLEMQEAAEREGMRLQVRSGFRDFATQLLIWNQKWRGERPLWSRQGVLLERARIDDCDMIDTILAWSAIPGGSRHHWGSDLDVVDAAAIPTGYEVQLVPTEYSTNGIFARLSAWLEGNLPHFGFFRPYRSDRGGYCPEPWHISYAPVAAAALEQLTPAVLQQALADSDLDGKSFVLDRLPEIYRRYLLNVDPP
jgi:LAS superfamily LD-carboxypeptidase LdcB